MRRRCLLSAGLATGSLAIAAQAGLLWPVTVLASDWPADGFYATRLEDAMAILFGGEPVEPSDHVQLQANAIAENGASVPIAIRTDLAGPLLLTLFSVSNPTPAVGRFELAPQLGGQLDTRVKMANSGDLIAVVTADGKHFSARRHIQVAAGGCG
ncbi:thiosulfate oxidation carrier protein SoxY [Thiocapsa rosea]|uniref:Sulfur-oxidizing protein SoxY n=1 Tax=Thiocapsa rosea TaxID=69360 RepID=A0A495V4H6_9GAMM|nr:thiosulfate oxidation carrier protein SoxY [Thiocapsa rosea]RKT43580.1 sulfur-oxidizing protein SoxY [Thiocapsa rosea]